MLLFPRLPLPRARAIASGFAGLSCEELRHQAEPVTLEAARFAPTGGSRISIQELNALKSRFDDLAHEAGWPKNSLAGRQRFDREVAAWLGARALPVGEALRAETWSWFAIKLVPYLVHWRFAGEDGTVSIERFAGPIQRNAIGRLWLRAWILDQGEESADRWSLAQAVSEDAAVAILERPTLASQHRLARSIARCWLAARTRGVRDVEGLLREAIKRVRIWAVVRDLNMLDDGALVRTIESAFEATLASRGQNASTTSPSSPDSSG